MNKPCLRSFLLLVTLATLLSSAACRRLSPVQTPAPHLHDTQGTQPVQLPLPTLPEDSPSPTRQPPSASADLPEIVSYLDGLPIDQFFEESFKLILLRDPEGVTTEGLAEVLGTRNDRLTDISEAALRQNQALYQAIYDLLLAYDRTGLTAEQQVSYDVYAWYLDDLLRLGEFSYDDYPVSPVVVTGVPYLLEYLFTEYHPMRDREDAQDYLSRLSQVGAKMDQLIEGLRLRQEHGVLMPRILLEASLGDIQRIAASPAVQTPFYQAFAEKLGGVSGLPAGEEQEMLAEAEAAIAQSVLPGYQALAKTLEGMPVNDSPAAGVWSHPNGAAYYQAALHHHTSTELTPDEIHQLGLEALAGIHEEMRQRFDLLGYPQDETLEQLYQRLALDGGIVQGGQILKDYETLIQDASQRLEEVFERMPQAGLEVAGYPGVTAFYSAPALDGSRPGVFYAPLRGAEPHFKLPTVAYHEGVPGHHFQISLARELDLPLLRSVITFNAYAEGWALYAERLTWELGWYEADPYADLGRLQMEAFRAARMVADTGLHAKQWTFSRGVDFMVENTGLERDYMQSEVVRYLAWPGQATSYGLGYYRLLELRQAAMDRLGERFDLKQFHQAVLQGGSLPLPVLERVVNEYITLASLEKVSDFPLYVMHYEGDYGFSAFVENLSQPASLNIGQPTPIEAAWACSGFSARNPAGEAIFGRNFDWHPHPALLLFTDPPDGYASVSMVDISYLDFTQEEAGWQERRGLLRAPYLPFDGMNSAGLAVGMMAVSEADAGADPGKATLNELQIIRLLLDNAANVEQALELMGSYNIDFGGGPPLHYFIADSSGKSAVVEFVGGEMRVLSSQQPWQVATNFLISQENPQGADSSCWRYNQAYEALEKSGGQISESESMALLEDISQGGDYPTIWSVVYNLPAGRIHLIVGRDYEQVYDFELTDNTTQPHANR